MITAYDTATHQAFQLDTKKRTLEWLGKLDTPPPFVSHGMVHQRKMVVSDGSNVQSTTPSYVNFWTGAAFLSGFPVNRPILNLYCEPISQTEKWGVTIVRSGKVMLHGGSAWYGLPAYEHFPFVNTTKFIETVDKSIRHICVSGADGDTLDDISYAAFDKSIYASPLREELALVGFLLDCSGLRPRRMNFVRPKKHDPENYTDEYEFDKTLPGDNAGQLARAVIAGPTYNDMCDHLGQSFFYQQVITLKCQVLWLLCPCYVVNVKYINDFFPEVVPSTKLYVASSAPVRMKANQEFQDTFHSSESTPCVRVVTDKDDDTLKTFMGFLNVMCGAKGFVTSSPNGTFVESTLPKDILHFRWHKAFRVKTKAIVKKL